MYYLSGIRAERVFFLRKLIVWKIFMKGQMIVIRKIKRFSTRVIPLVICLIILTVPQVFAVEDMWTVANRIIIDVYNKIAGISTVLAGLMTTVCVVGMKLSNNQQKVDQSMDWLKRIWIAWAIINGIGAFLAYVRPLLTGLATLT